MTVFILRNMWYTEVKNKRKGHILMKKKLQKLIIPTIIIVVIAVIAAIILWVVKHRGITYTSYSVKAELEMKGNTDAAFMYGDTGVIRYTRDGVSAYDSKGKEVWNVSYEMSNPVGDACGSYAAVADEGSVNLYVLDGTGRVYQITTEHSIEHVAVAGNGVTAVWMNDGDKDYITIYKMDGTKISDIMTTTVTDGIPVAIDLSVDGTKLVTSYAYFEENNLKNQVSFYNFGEVGSNYVDRLVGVKKFDDRLVADVEFAGNDTVVAFSDKGINIFAMEEYEEDVAQVEISSTVKSVAVGEEYIGVVTVDELGSQTVKVYDLQGDKKDEKTLEQGYESFSINGSEMIFYGDTSLYIVRIGGNEKAVVEMSMDIKGVYSVDGKRTYMIIGEQSLQTIELKQNKEEGK